jgi:hypothetical protein
VADQVRDPREGRLISMRQRDPGDLQRSASHALVESIALDQIRGCPRAPMTAKLELLDPRQEILPADPDHLVEQAAERPSRRAGAPVLLPILAREVVHERGAREPHVAIEQWLQSFD